MFMVRQAPPEDASRLLRQAQDERPAYRRAQHEREMINVFNVWSVRPEPVEACDELRRAGERRVCAMGLMAITHDIGLV